MVDLTELNPQQRQAVATTEGSLLVLAGAGSGKTRVITYRIAHLLDMGVPASRILALSFTNKAATEMRERIENMMGRAARNCVLSTFHSLGVRFLRAEPEAVGLTAKFTILDEADQRDAVRRGVIKLGFDPQRFEPKAIHAHISECKGLMRTPDPRVAPIAARVYPLYQQRLRALNGVDFDDLINLPVQALESKSETGLALRSRWFHRFRYIMVDEYQDTNASQLRMVQALAGHGNVCVVGDDDQSIYAWRGAVAGNILHFDHHFPGASMISLTQNYRSTNNILRAANAVIENNVERHVKMLWSENGDGPLLRYHLADNDEKEAEWIATDVLSHHHTHLLPWPDCAILYRTNAQSRALEEALRGINIPYRLVGGTQFYDRKEVRDVVGYLRVIANPLDENAWRRIVNYPPRKVGDKTVQRLADTATELGQPFWRMVQNPEHVAGIPAKTQATLKAFEAKIAEFRKRFTEEPLGEVCKDLIKTFGFADALQRAYPNQNMQIRKRMNNVEELASALTSYQGRKPEATLLDYLTVLSLDRQDEKKGDEDEECISLMTIHASKGLEFPAVWLAGVEEGFMPHQRVLDGDGELAEERRLTYVGITRAKRYLCLSGAKKRLKYGRVQHRRPSRFLDEIPENLIQGGRQGRAPKKTQAERQVSNRSKFSMMNDILSSSEDPS